ncbi:MAG: asparaginase, partial [Pseudomonadota bacterium]
PNFACTLTGLARAMAGFAAAREGAEAALREAMMAHPELVAGETRACTELMRAAPGAALKTGAEGVFIAILRDQKLGVALKIADGATRAAEAAIAALLIRLGALDPAYPAALKRLGPITNWAGRETGRVAAGAALA